MDPLTEYSLRLILTGVIWWDAGFHKSLLSVLNIQLSRYSLVINEGDLFHRFSRAARNRREPGSVTDATRYVGDFRRHIVFGLRSTSDPRKGKARGSRVPYLYFDSFLNRDEIE